MKCKKRTLYVLICLTLAAGLLAGIAVISSGADRPIYTIACFTDIHCETNTNRLRDPVINSLAYIGETEDIDMMIIGGDIASNYSSNKTRSTWESIKGDLNTYLPTAFSDRSKSGNIMYVAGNHEYDLCRESSDDFNSADYYTGMMLSSSGMGPLADGDAYYGSVSTQKTALTSVLLAYHYEVSASDGSSVHFVGLNTGSYLYGSNTNYTYDPGALAWCRDKVDSIYEKTPGALVIFAAHIPFNDSNGIRLNYGMTNADADLKNTLAKYPNLIYLYGHDHQMDNGAIKSDVSQRVTQYYLTPSGTASKSDGSGENTPGFISSFMGSMAYYGGSLGGQYIGFVNGSVLQQVLMIYVYPDHVELNMKNTGALGREYTQHSSSSSLTINKELTPYEYQRTLTSVPVQKIYLPETVELVTDTSSRLETVVLPANATDRTITWSIEPSGIVSVSEGIITALSPGTAVVTAASSNGITAQCTVTVKNLDVTSLALETHTASIFNDPGLPLYLIADTVPESPAAAAVTWTSSNESVALVDAYGKVTPVEGATGTTTITAASSADASVCDTCIVTVTEKTGDFPLLRAHVAYLNVINGSRLLPNYDLSRLDLALSLGNLISEELESEAQSSSAAVPYTDLANVYKQYENAERAISVLYKTGIISDVYNGEFFSPNTGVTRGELCRIITAMTGCAYAEAYASVCSDLSASDDEGAACLTAVNYGWLNAFDDGTFAPDKTVSRMQFVYTMNKVLGRSVKKVYVESGFADSVNYFEDVDSNVPGYVSLYEATTTHIPAPDIYLYHEKGYEKWIYT